MGTVELVIIVGFVVCLAAIWSIFRPPSSPGWSWGAFIWGPIYYLVYGMWKKGLLLTGISVAVGAVTFGYGLIIAGPVIWIYSALNAHDEWSSIQNEKNTKIKDAAIIREAAVAQVRLANLETQKRIDQVETTTAKNDPSPEERLQKLKSLLDKGMITPDEYQAKRQKIVEEL